MEFIGKHKVSGKEIYKFGSKHYTKEGDNFMVMDELTDEQKRMMKALHSPEAKEIKYRP